MFSSKARSTREARRDRSSRERAKLITNVRARVQISSERRASSRGKGRGERLRERHFSENARIPIALYAIFKARGRRTKSCVSERKPPVFIDRQFGIATRERSLSRDTKTSTSTPDGGGTNRVSRVADKPAGRNYRSDRRSLQPRCVIGRIRKGAEELE